MGNRVKTPWRLLAASSAALLLLTACPQPPAPPPASTPTPAPSPTPTPVPTPTPIPALVRKPLPTATLFNGIALESAVVAEPGEELASTDRKESDAYKVEVTLRLRLPRAASTMEDILSNKPELASALPSLPTLLDNARV